MISLSKEKEGDWDFQEAVPIVSLTVSLENISASCIFAKCLTVLSVKCATMKNT